MNMIVAEALRKMTGCEIYTTQGHSLWVLWCWLVQLNGYPLGLEFDRHICLVMSKLGISEPKYLSSHVKTHIQRIPSRTYDSLQPNKQRPRRSSTSQLQSWETKAGQKQRGNCVWIRRQTKQPVDYAWKIGVAALARTRTDTVAVFPPNAPCWMKMRWNFTFDVIWFAVSANHE